jgi:hypothetical protein
VTDVDRGRGPDLDCSDVATIISSSRLKSSFARYTLQGLNSKVLSTWSRSARLRKRAGSRVYAEVRGAKMVVA